MQPIVAELYDGMLEGLVVDRAPVDEGSGDLTSHASSPSRVKTKRSQRSRLGG